MFQIVQDLRFGLRTLLKTPGFSLVAVLVLALGIGANSAMFTLVNAMMFKPLAGQADQLFGLYSHDRTKPDSYRAFSYSNYADIRDRNDVFEGLAAYTFAMVGVTKEDATRQTFVAVVSSDYFDTLAVPLAAGRSFSREEERPGARIPVVIVGADRAALLGQTIRINAIDFTVVGVAPRGFTGTMALVAPEMWAAARDVRRRRERHVQEQRNRAGGSYQYRRSWLPAGSSPASLRRRQPPRLDALSRQLEARVSGREQGPAAHSQPAAADGGQHVSADRQRDCRAPPRC